MRRRRSNMIVWLLAILALAGVAAYLLMNPQAIDMFRPTKTIEDKKVIDATVIAFAGSPYSDDFGYLRVPGYVDNISKSEVKSVSLKIQLSDKDGNKKELVEHVVENIAPNSRVTFDLNAGVISPDRTPQISVEKIEVY